MLSIISYQLINKFNSFLYLLFSVPSVEGGIFNISKVNRLHMGPYLCIASNGVPPTVSKRIMLIVHCKLFFMYLSILNTMKILLYFSSPNDRNTESISWRNGRRRNNT